MAPTPALDAYCEQAFWLAPGGSHGLTVGGQRSSVSGPATAGSVTHSAANSGSIEYIFFMRSQFEFKKNIIYTIIIWCRTRWGFGVEFSFVHAAEPLHHASSTALPDSNR